MNRVAILMIAVVSAAAATQGPAVVQLGGVSLNLGMTESQVDEALARTYTIVKRPTNNVAFGWWDITIPTNLGKFTYVAGLSFRNGRLSSIRRSWGPSDQQAGVPFAKALYGAANQLVAEGRRQCILDVGSRPQPGAEARTIFLTCSGKRLEVGIVEGDQVGNVAMLDEVLDTER